MPKNTRNVAEAATGYLQQPQEQEEGWSSFWRHALSTGAPALLWTAVGCPFDVIKTRMQTATTAMTTKMSPSFSSPFQCLCWTIRKDGVTALWRGFAPQLLLTTPYSMIMFGTYQSLKPDDFQSNYNYLCRCFLAGAASGVAVTVIHNPLEVWRVRVQTHLPLRGDNNTRAARTNSTILKSLLCQPRRLGRGASMTLAENVVGNAAFFGFNETMHLVFPATRSLATELLVGGMTGVVFQLVVYPMDLVKARLITNESVTAVRIALQILQQGGIRGFYRGSSVAIARACFINAAGWPALRLAQWRLGVSDTFQ